MLSHQSSIFFASSRKFNDFRKPSQICLDYPPMAIQCCLFNVKPYSEKDDVHTTAFMAHLAPSEKKKLKIGYVWDEINIILIKEWSHKWVISKQKIENECSKLKVFRIKVNE